MGTAIQNRPGLLKNALWYGAGAAGYIVVIACLAVAASRRPRPAQELVKEQTDKVMHDVSNALREARGEEVDFEFAKPVEADITKHVSTSYDGSQRMLTLNHRKITDRDLVKVKSLGDGLYVSFEQSKLPPRALRHLAGMTLTTLELARSSLTDDDLGDLPQVKAVQRLVLDGTKVTDAALPHIANCPGLRDLHLKDTAVTDNGVAALARAPDLRLLDLEGTQVSGSAFSGFTESGALKEINLNRTPVTDDTLPALLRLKLERLDVQDTKVSDLGLEKVTGNYPRLIDVKGSRVTERGAQALKKRCPTVVVVGIGPPNPGEREMDRAKKQIDDIKKLIPRP